GQLAKQSTTAHNNAEMNGRITSRQPPSNNNSTSEPRYCSMRVGDFFGGEDSACGAAGLSVRLEFIVQLPFSIRPAAFDPAGQLPSGCRIPFTAARAREQIPSVRCCTVKAGSPDT